jgi:anti-anti-sigma factor
MDFSINTLSCNGDSTVAIEGELDVATVPQFLGAVDSCLEKKPRRLLVDATRIRFLASIGAEALLVAAARCYQRAVNFGLQASPETRRTLDLLDLWWLGILDDGFSIEMEVGGEAVDLDGWGHSGTGATRAKGSFGAGKRHSRPRSNRRKPGRE